jgi:hypothetical protein
MPDIKINFLPDGPPHVPAVIGQRGSADNTCYKHLSRERRDV